MTVVPTFAPRVIGNACSRVNNPAPARGTSKAVVMKLDCTITVTRSPTSIERTTLEPSTPLTNFSTRVS